MKYTGKDFTAIMKALTAGFKGIDSPDEEVVAN